MITLDPALKAMNPKTRINPPIATSGVECPAAVKYNFNFYLCLW